VRSIGKLKTWSFIVDCQEFAWLGAAKFGPHCHREPPTSHRYDSTEGVGDDAGIGVHRDRSALLRPAGLPLRANFAAAFPHPHLEI